MSGDLADRRGHLGRAELVALRALLPAMIRHTSLLTVRVSASLGLARAAGQPAIIGCTLLL
jgi:hypothetical protein